MVLSEADWKNQPHQTLNWFAMVIALAIITVSLFLWWKSGQVESLGIGVIFSAWLTIFFTDYWQSILYLAMALIVIFSASLLLLGGSWNQPLDQALLLLNAVFLLLIVYLFFYEEPID